MLMGHQAKPFATEALLIAPTLFMVIGAFFWVPLTHAFGRRSPFILASIVLLVATLGAAMTTKFWSLIFCLCAIGFGEGFSLSVVSSDAL